MMKKTLWVSIWMLLLITMKGQNPYQRGGGSVYDTRRGNTVEQDSLGADSLNAREITVKPEVLALLPDQLWRFGAFHGKVSDSRPNMHLWDETERIKGFVYALGQMGKPYQAFTHGLPFGEADSGAWVNKITGAADAYLSDQLPYFDTKTPYFTFRYVQGARRLQRLDAILSRNITPNWNIAFSYQRRQATGAYLSFNTNHESVGLSSHYQNKNKRYQTFVDWNYKGLRDNMNGGTLRDSLTQTDAGEYEDVTSLLPAAFAKNEAPVLFSSAQRRRFLRSYEWDNYFYLIGHPDSVEGRHKLMINGKAAFENYKDHYEDDAVDQTAISDHTLPAYPLYGGDSTRITLLYGSNHYLAQAGLSYKFGLKYSWLLQGHVGYSRTVFSQDTLNTAWNVFFQTANAVLQLPGIRLSGGYRQQVSELFSPETRLWAESVFSLQLKRKPQAIDTLNTDTLRQSQTTTWTLRANLSRTGKNPTLYEGFYRGNAAYSFLPDPSLENRQINKAVVRLSGAGTGKITEKDTLLSNHYYLEAFTSLVNKPVYYDSLFRLQQGGSLSWVGLEFGGRARIFGRMYAEGHVNWQSGSTSSVDALEQYSSGIPELYGKLGLFFERRNLSFARLLRIGVEAYSFSPYQGFSHEAASGLFYPSYYKVDAYTRLDVYIASHIKRSDIFVRYSHLNEGLGVAGYYTTPFYPMLERTFSLGVSWAFYD